MTSEEFHAWKEADIQAYYYSLSGPDREGQESFK